MLEVFSKMGMQIARTGNSVTVQAQETPQGISFDGNKAIDSVPVIVAAACFANSPSLIYNVANLRLKESNRIDDLAAELSKAGCSVVPSAGAIEVQPSPITGRPHLDAHADA